MALWLLLSGCLGLHAGVECLDHTLCFCCLQWNDSYGPCTSAYCPIVSLVDKEFHICMQGPFEQAQLQAWQAWLPTDLQLWHSDGHGGGGMTVLAQCVSAHASGGDAGAGAAAAANGVGMAPELLSGAACSSGGADGGAAQHANGAEVRMRSIAAASGFAAGGSPAERPSADAPRAQAARDSFESYAQAALAGAPQ